MPQKTAPDRAAIPRVGAPKTVRQCSLVRVLIICSTLRHRQMAPIRDVMPRKGLKEYGTLAQHVVGRERSRLADTVLLAPQRPIPPKHVNFVLLIPDNSHLANKKHRPTGEGFTHDGMMGTKSVLKDSKGPLVQRLGLSGFPLFIREKCKQT